MAIPVELVSDGIPFRLTRSGELVVAPVAYDLTEFNAMSSTGTAYSFYGPKVDFRFIITGFVAVSDKNITADAVVEIYEASAEDETTVSKTLIQFAITKNAVVAPTPLRILVTDGVWVNAKTDDATINMTMFGYYAHKVSNRVET